MMSQITDLELQYKKSILNNITCFEEIPMDIFNLLLNSSLLNVDKFLNFENEKQQLLKYKKLIKNNIASITYHKSKGIKYGRVCPVNGLGMHCIRREIRHTLLQDKYVDIDIINAHPNILYQICKRNNIECEYLYKYINDRDNILNEVMTYYSVPKDAAKKLFIQLLYYGTFKSWCSQLNIDSTSELDFIKHFKSELNLIGEIIISHNNKLVKSVQKYKLNKKNNMYNEKGSIISFYLQEYENQILECVYSYCVEKEYIINNDCVLCNDGIMIKKR